MYPYSSAPRVPYAQLKEGALHAYFDYCRDRGIRKGMTHAEIWGYVTQLNELGFEYPVEDVMWSCISYVLAGGWHDQYAAYYKTKIEDHLADKGLAKLLEGVPADEAETFATDLRLLGFVAQSDLPTFPTA